MSTSSFLSLRRPFFCAGLTRGQLQGPPIPSTPMNATDLADDRSRPTR